MALDDRGEHFIPTEEQVSDRNPMIVGGGYAPETGRGSNFVTEAPADGEVYGRGDNSWVRLDLGGPFNPPPMDDKYYIIRNGRWTEATINVEIKPEEIKLDPPVMGKDNLRDLLAVLVKGAEPTAKPVSHTHSSNIPPRRRT